MSDPYSAIAMLAVSAYQASQKPAQPPNLAPPPPPQQAVMPNAAGLYGALGGTGQAGGPNGKGKSGQAQTFLTGASGVDSNALKLNKPTLLGE